jgi:prephenate dehydrogenase
MSDSPNDCQPHDTPRLTIVGHRGRMGAMLTRRWQEAGLTVTGVDRPDDQVRPGGARSAIDPQELRRAVQGADVVLLAIPAGVFPALLHDLAPALLPEQILADIASVKTLPMRRMEASHQGPVVGTHPLFGPNPLPEDMVTAVTPGERAGEEHIRLVEELFALLGCRTFRTSVEEHDRGVAFVQGLNFVSSAAYLASLAQRDDLMPFITPSFRRRLEGARKLLTEDAEMFEGFTIANPMIRDAVHSFRLFLDMTEGNGLHDVVDRARWWYQ